MITRAPPALFGGFSLHARFVLERRLSGRDPLKLDPPFEHDAIRLLLEDRPLPLAEVVPPVP